MSTRLRLCRVRKYGQAVTALILMIAFIVSIVALTTYMLTYMRTVQGAIEIRGQEQILEQQEKLIVNVTADGVMELYTNSTPIHLVRIWTKNKDTGEVKSYTLTIDSDLTALFNEVLDEVVVKAGSTSITITSDNCEELKKYALLTLGIVLELHFKTNLVGKVQVAFESYRKFYGWYDLEYKPLTGEYILTTTPGLAGSILSITFEDIAVPEHLNKYFEMLDENNDPEGGQRAFEENGIEGCEDYVLEQQALLDDPGTGKYYQIEVYREHHGSKYAVPYSVLAIGNDLRYGGKVIVLGIGPGISSPGPAHITNVKVYAVAPDGTPYLYTLETGEKIVIRGFRGTLKVFPSMDYEVDEEGKNITALCTMLFYRYYRDESTTYDAAAIYITGRAKVIEVYKYVYKEYTGYRNYMFVGDFDGNGLNEIVFNTIHIWYGEKSTKGNDWDANIHRDEKSVTELKLVLKDYGGKPYITGAKFITVYIKFYFLDNAGDDWEELDANEWIFFVALYEITPEGKYVEYMRKEWRYQQLMTLEDTYPPSISSITESASFPCDPSKKYVVVVGIQDPYGNDGLGYNDADIVIGIEYLGITYYV